MSAEQNNSNSNVNTEVAISESELPPTRTRYFLILGAGPTALGALYRFYQLRKQKLIPENVKVCVLEQEHEVGGLARTVTDDYGFSWDLGVHVMGNSKYVDFWEALAESIPEWRIIPRCAMADMSHVMTETDDHGELAERASKTDTDKKKEQQQKLCPLDCYVPYPVQSSIPYFPEPVKRHCLDELANLPEDEFDEQRKQGREPSEKQEEEQDFDSFSLALFGPTLQQIFIRPYNEKVWTVRLADMGTSWLEGRVPLIDWTQLALRCALSREELLAEDCRRQTAFRYPAKCRGVGEMWRRFAANNFPADVFKFGHRVVQISDNEKLVRTKENLFNSDCSRKSAIDEKKEKDWPFDWLLSTIPLTELSRLGLSLDWLTLRHSTVILVGIGLHGGQTDFTRRLSWAYYPRPEIIFYRCTLLSNFSPEMVPRPSSSTNLQPSAFGEKEDNSAAASDTPFWSVLCEIGQNPEQDIPSGREQKAKLARRVVQDLIKVGIVRSEQNICSHWIRVVPYGYPVPSKDRDSQLARCHAQLEQHDIFSRGRFGGWRYEVSNQDHRSDWNWSTVFFSDFQRRCTTKLNFSLYTLL